MLTQRIYRPANLQQDLRTLHDRQRECLARAANVLALPVPDLFLGRQQQSLVPLPNQTVAKWD
jgi:hypothetical protein